MLQKLDLSQAYKPTLEERLEKLKSEGIDEILKKSDAYGYPYVLAMSEEDYKRLRDNVYLYGIADYIGVVHKHKDTYIHGLRKPFTKMLTHLTPNRSQEAEDNYAFGGVVYTYPYDYGKYFNTGQDYIKFESEEEHCHIVYSVEDFETGFCLFRDEIELLNPRILTREDAEDLITNRDEELVNKKYFFI